MLSAPKIETIEQDITFSPNIDEEYVYTSLYITDMFDVPCPENFMDIILEYKKNKVSCKFEEFAKDCFNKIMKTNFANKKIEIEVLYFISYIKNLGYIL